MLCQLRMQRRQAVNIWRHYLWNRIPRSHSEKNINSVLTEDTKKAIDENMEALSTEDDSKYSSSDTMVHVWIKDHVKYTSSESDICNPKFPRECGFAPLMPLANLLYHFSLLIPSCSVTMPVRRMIPRQSVKIHQAVTGNIIEEGKCISEYGSDK